jgi:hypothetical protein
LRPHDGSCGSAAFDFGSLVPVPTKLMAAARGGPDDTIEAALDPIGYGSIEDWAEEHWGTKWNARHFHEISNGSDCYDCYFLTAWAVPVPVFEALASRFPQLSGTVFAIEEGEHFGFAGEIQHGAFVEGWTEVSRELNFLVQGWTECPEHHRAPPAPLGSYSLQTKSEVDPEGLILETWTSLRAMLPAEVLAHSDFAADLLGYLRWCHHRHTTSRNVSAEQYVRSASNLSFFLSVSACWTGLDKQMMEALAAYICTSPSHSPSADAQWFAAARRLARRFNEDQLRQWAVQAILRGVRSVDTLDLNSLQQSFIRYAATARDEALDYIPSTT